MSVPSPGHCGFPSLPVVDWLCLFFDLLVLPFPLEDCSVFCNFVITLNDLTDSEYINNFTTNETEYLYISDNSLRLFSNINKIVILFHFN
jgi:hypothetical protein